MYSIWSENRSNSTLSVFVRFWKGLCYKVLKFLILVFVGGGGFGGGFGGAPIGGGFGGGCGGGFY